MLQMLYGQAMLGKPHTIKAKKKFLEALKKRRGIVTLACKEADVSPMTFYRWQNDDPEFYQMSEEIRDVEIGIIAEDRLAEYIIVHKDPNMIRFYLQSRSRKYIQRLQMQTEDPSKVLADILKLDEF